MDAIAALAHSDAALAGPELRTALADPNIRAAVADPVIKVPLVEPEVNVSPLEVSDECVLSEECIDQYLWSVYGRARKVDTIKVQEQIKTTVKKNGKSRTVTKTVTKLVNEDFTWKDPHAAEKAGMSVAQYVIGGIDRGFKVRLYHLFRALDDAGLAPGMTSGFRDDYRQSIASGNKAATDRSYHGGSRRGGYGHGLAADVVSVSGETRSGRWISTENLGKWVDAKGKEFGFWRSGSLERMRRMTGSIRRRYDGCDVDLDRATRSLPAPGNSLTGCGIRTIQPTSPGSRRKDRIGVVAASVVPTIAAIWAARSD